MQATRAVHPARRAGLVLMLACAIVGASCIQESWDPGPYRFCTTEAQCRSNESCVEVQSSVGDAGSALAGVCTQACTVSTLASSVYAGAGSDGRVCVGIDASGQVDTSTLGVPGWFLEACGNEHRFAGSTEYRIVCTPFDYGGYPIDLWIPTP